MINYKIKIETFFYINFFFYIETTKRRKDNMKVVDKTYIYFLRSLMCIVYAIQVSPTKKKKTLYNTTVSEHKTAKSLYLFPSMETYWKNGEFVVLSGTSDELDKKIRWHQFESQTTTVPIVGYMMNEKCDVITGIVYPRVTYFKLPCYEGGKTRQPIYPLIEPLFLKIGGEINHGACGSIRPVVSISGFQDRDSSAFQFHPFEPLSSEIDVLFGTFCKIGLVDGFGLFGNEPLVQHNAWKRGVPVPKVFGVLTDHAQNYIGFLMEKIEGVTILEWLLEKRHPQSVLDEVYQKAINILRLFNSFQLEHYDAYCNNFMVNPSTLKVTLIDMGRAETKRSRKKRLPNQPPANDVQTFNRHWDETLKKNMSKV